MHALAVATTFLSSLSLALAGMPDKIYGVNLGSWLVLEAWMLPAGSLCRICRKID